MLWALATAPPARATFTNSAYLRVDVLGATLSVAPQPDAGTCFVEAEAEPAARALLTLRISNYSPIEIRGWRLAVMAGDVPAQACLLGGLVDRRLPSIDPGAWRDIVVVAYAPIDAAFTLIDAQWQGERYAICADNGSITKGCAPMLAPKPTVAIWASAPLPDFLKSRADESTIGQMNPSPTTTPTPTANPVPTPTPTRLPAAWAVTDQALDVSAWGRPIQGSCFFYDDGDPITRWQAGLRIENVSSAEMRDLRVTFFDGGKPLRTCFHGYGGSMPVIPPADGRNISFFAFAEKGQLVTSVLIEAMGQSRRMCVATGKLIACK